eukprot:936675-Pelagomonas_calceolata.AAC.1
MQSGALLTRKLLTAPHCTLLYHAGPLRGRAEVMRLALSLANQDWIEQTVDYAGKQIRHVAMSMHTVFAEADTCLFLAAMKSDKEAFPFGQAPAYKDGGLHILQSGTILR